MGTCQKAASDNGHEEKKLSLLSRCIQVQAVKLARRSVGEKLSITHIQQAPKHPEKKMILGCSFTTA